VKRAHRWALGALLVPLTVGTWVALRRHVYWAGPGLHSLDEPAALMHHEGVELQVAIHDLVEGADELTHVRVCRLLASKSVSLDVNRAEPLGEALEGLARQVGSRMVVGASGPGEPGVPTIPCPKGVGDYLEIGSPGPTGGHASS